MRISDWSSDVCSSDLLSQHSWQWCQVPTHYFSPGYPAFIWPDTRTRRPAWLPRPFRQSGARRRSCRRGRRLGCCRCGLADAHRTNRTTRHHVTIKVGREGTQLLGNRLVATHHPVVAEHRRNRSEEHTSELQSLIRTSYAVFCSKNK